MNRFRKNKKMKDVSEEIEAVPSSTATSSKLIKKSKKGEVEPKLEIDLSTALPSSDNFRTSLLMPNLSARFSMLREQDDPTTKLGKANDDSVLFPKRASRLNLFGHTPNPLSDIAEVSSIHGRPSLALGRTDSYASAEDGTDDDMSQNGGIINRKRPGEGNNLFGGRQKVYKIPVGAASGTITPNPESAGMRGRAVYDDDVTLSAFQRLRLKEKEQKLTEISSDYLGDSITAEPEDSLPVFSAKRTTSSSTTSGRSNCRTSTAATSIDEQPISGSYQGSALNVGGTPTSPNKPSWPPSSLERNATKTRRLYGQGLAQAVQDQQSSALTRLESISRQRTGAGTADISRLNRSFSRSATNLHDRLPRLSPVQAAPAYRGNSPPLSANSPESHALDVHPLATASSINDSAGSPGYGIVPPLSPPISETEDVSALAAALHPDDRGKATAMGLFNKPHSAYDEQQFTRRQLQMHEGRNTPPLRRRSPPNGVFQPESVTRPRGFSTTSYRSQAESASSRYSSEANHTGPSSGAPSVQESSPIRAANTTFMMNLSGSDSEGDAGDDVPLKKVPSARSQAFDGVHPAFRARPASKDSDPQPSVRESQDLPEVKYSELHDLNTIEENQAAEAPPSPILEEASEKAPDSPTLGPSGLGLSGLIRTHLRHDSNVSSIYPPPSPGLPNQQYLELRGYDAREAHPPSSIHSNPWEYDDPVGQKPAAAEKALDPSTLSGVQSAASNISMRAKQLRDQAAALREHHNESRAGSRAENHSQRTVPWQDELRFTHKRDGSSETQKEREEFAHELAERRKRVQENLRSIGEADSRANSPVPGHQTPDLNQTRPGNAFALLKNRSVRPNPLGRQDHGQSKGLKMLGLGGAPMNASTPSLVSSDSWKDGEMAHNLGKHSNSSSPHIPSGRIVPPRSSPSRNGSYGSQEDSREPDPNSRAPSPSSFTSRQRDRSTSASGRSKSRPIPRDDLQMVAEHSVSRYKSPQSDEQRVPSVPTSARESVEVNDRPYERSISAASGRYRSNSRAAAPGYLDIPPPKSADISSIGTSPRPSPVTPYSANATPPLYETDGETPGVSPSALAFGGYNFPQRALGSNNLQKRVVDKSRISEPTFVSSTSNVPTVGLPTGASLSNGMETPPIPPMNPRRRRQTTQTILGALKGEKPHVPSMPTGKENAEERSTFSDDDDKRSLPRQKLRKTSSEGGSLNARARQQAMMTPSPAMPYFPPQTSVEGGMI